MFNSKFGTKKFGNSTSVFSKYVRKAYGTLQTAVRVILQTRPKPKSGYILAGVIFVKMAGFRPEPESGTALV
jgi:hypothetical protein